MNVSAEDLFLAVLFADGRSSVKGRTRLQKTIYILAKSLDLDSFDFKPYDYGGCSEEIIDLEEEYQNVGYVVEDNEGIRLTDEGVSAAVSSWDSLNEKLQEQIETIKKFTNSLSEDELIVYVYSQWPKDACNSLIKERIMRGRIDIAVSMYRKSKVSLQRAAIIAGMSEKEFIELLSSRKIPVIEA